MIPGLTGLNGQLDQETLGHVMRILNEQAVLAAAAAEQRQAAVGRLNRQDTYALNGVGATRYRFDSDHFFMTAALQGASPRDPDFKPWMANREDGDYAKVRCRGTRIQSGFTGLAECDYRQPLFHKSYA